MNHRTILSRLTVLALASAFAFTISVPLSTHAIAQESESVDEAKQDGAAQETTQEQLVEFARESQEFLAAGQYEKSIAKAQKVLDVEPRALRLQIQIGSCHFMLAEMDQAIASYDKTIQREPRLKPQLWQRGLALYYAERFEDGKEQFETHQTYNTQDVENAVWHMLCNAKVVGLEKARESLIEINQDSRVPMKQVHQLFAGDIPVEKVIETAKSSEATSDDQRNQHLYYAHLYSGLYYEMVGDDANAKKQMELAAKINPIPKRFLMGSVADVHLKLREQSESSKNNAADPGSNSTDDSKRDDDK